MRPILRPTPEFATSPSRDKLPRILWSEVVMLMSRRLWLFKGKRVKLPIARCGRPDFCEIAPAQ